MFVKRSVYISALLLLISSANASVETSEKSMAFTDPNQRAKVDASFLSQKIKYGAKVGDVDLVVTLGQQTYPALHEMVAKIAKDKGIKVDIQRGSCGSTAKKLLKKSVDIGTYCCPPGKSDRLPGLEFHTIGIAPLLLVTNTANPVEDVSSDDALKIFQGEYVYWSEVPGTESLSSQLTGKTIQPVARMHCKKRPGHWRGLIKGPDSFSPKVQEVGVIPDMIKHVAENKTAIGFETSYMLKVHKEKGELKILNIDGYDPENLDHLLHGKYPLYRTYNLTTWSNAENKNELALQLVKELTEYIEKHGNKINFISSSELRLADWKFKNDELIGQPDGMPVISERQ